MLLHLIKAFLFVFFIMQQPPSPWLNQRPPLDVNVGKLYGKIVTYIDPEVLHYYYVFMQLMMKVVKRWTWELLINQWHRWLSYVVNFCGCHFLKVFMFTHKSGTFCSSFFPCKKISVGPAIHFSVGEVESKQVPKHTNLIHDKLVI